MVVIPSVVDETRFKRLPHYVQRRGGERIVVGWIGAANNLHYLEPLRPVIKDLSLRYPGKVVLKVVSSEELCWDDVPIENKAWLLEDEAQDVASFDIGIMPLTDDQLSRMKCGYKAFLYMSMGVPAVVSPVGANKVIVRHGGDTGFHARDLGEWSTVLSQLVEGRPRTIRERIGRASAVNFVHSKYSIEAVLPLWLKVLRTVSAHGHRAAIKAMPAKRAIEDSPRNSTTVHGPK